MSKKVDFVKKLITDLFQFERLDTLARRNPIVAISYAQLVAHLNYALLRVGGGDEDKNITIAGIAFDGSTPQGKINACAEAFRHMANKIDDMMSTQFIGSILTAIQAGEIAKSAIGATRFRIDQKQLKGDKK